MLGTWEIMMLFSFLLWLLKDSLHIIYWWRWFWSRVIIFSLSSVLNTGLFILVHLVRLVEAHRKILERTIANPYALRGSRSLFTMNFPWLIVISWLSFNTSPLITIVPFYSWRLPCDFTHLGWILLTWASFPLVSLVFSSSLFLKVFFGIKT